MNDAPIGIEYVAVNASRDILQGDLGKMLEVDPAGGAIVLTCPPIFGGGFNLMVRQSGPGTVSFVAGAGASVVSSSGGTPQLAGQWSAVTLDNRNGTQWAIIGGII